MIRKIATALFFSCALGGCALLSKSQAITPRYYTPDYAEAPGHANMPPAASGDRTLLRLGRVDAGSSLRERMVYRVSEQELGFYEYQRWTERPENYLRRALSRALFEERGFVRVVSGAAPTVQAELITFEEVRGTSPKVRIQIGIALDDDRVTRLEQTITVERALPVVPEKDRPAAVARALGEALHEAVETISRRVQESAPAPAPDAVVTN